MCTCWVCVLGYGLTFYVVGCARVSRAFRFVDLNAYISHACFSISGLTNCFVGFRLLRSCRMAIGDVQRGVTPLAHWGIFSCAFTALRKCPNKLWLFCFQKPVRVPSSYSLSQCGTGLPAYTRHHELYRPHEGDDLG